MKTGRCLVLNYFSIFSKPYTITFSNFDQTIPVPKKKQVVNRSIEVTGIVISGNTLKLPNRKHLKIRNCRVALQQEKDVTKREEMNKKLTGNLAESKKIDCFNAGHTQILDDIK